MRLTMLNRIAGLTGPVRNRFRSKSYSQYANESSGTLHYQAARTLPKSLECWTCTATEQFITFGATPYKLTNFSNLLCTSSEVTCMFPRKKNRSTDNLPILEGCNSSRVLANQSSHRNSCSTTFFCIVDVQLKAP